MKLKKKAIEFLYYKFNDYFTQLIKGFLKNEFKTESGYTLKKLDKKLEYLVESSLTHITELKRAQVIRLEVIKEYKFTIEEVGNE